MSKLLHAPNPANILSGMRRASPDHTHIHLLSEWGGIVAQLIVLKPHSTLGGKQVTLQLSIYQYAHQHSTFRINRILYRPVEEIVRSRSNQT